MTDTEIEQKIKNILVEEFEVDAGGLTRETNLFTELDLDSIDAVDLVVRLQREIDKKVNPEDFRQIRTLGDVVSAVSKLVNECSRWPSLSCSACRCCPDANRSVCVLPNVCPTAFCRTGRWPIAAV